MICRLTDLGNMSFNRAPAPERLNLGSHHQTQEYLITSLRKAMTRHRSTVAADHSSRMVEARARADPVGSGFKHLPWSCSNRECRRML